MYLRPQVSHPNGRSFECFVLVWLDKFLEHWNVFPHSSQIKFCFNWVLWTDLIWVFICFLIVCRTLYLQMILNKGKIVVQMKICGKHNISAHVLWHSQHSNGRSFECNVRWHSKWSRSVNTRSQSTHLNSFTFPGISIGSPPFDWTMRNLLSISSTFNSMNHWSI